MRIGGGVVRTDYQVENTRSDIEAGFRVRTSPALARRGKATGFGLRTAELSGMISAD
jgi:hypothetical protein